MVAGGFRGLSRIKAVENKLFFFQLKRKIKRVFL
jgi:hypothetical protein